MLIKVTVARSRPKLKDGEMSAVIPVMSTVLFKDDEIPSQAVTLHLASSQKLISGFQTLIRYKFSGVLSISDFLNL